jgi:F-type H+-transporting ATPase subunit delta
MLRPKPSFTTSPYLLAAPPCIIEAPLLTGPRTMRGRLPAPPFSHGPTTLGEWTRVENSGGIQASLSGRYATALFGLARDEKALDAVSASLATLKGTLAESDELRQLTTSPVVTRDQAAKAIAAAAAAMGLDPLTTKFLGVLAQNRRLSQIGAVIRAFGQLAAAHRGETTAEVTSAHPLTATQVKALTAKLKTQLARDVAVDLTVDPSILGGLIVKIGSRQIDGSIRSKLNTLAIAMKG